MSKTSTKTKVDIISGFLGAGKTTLIKKLIEHLHSHEQLAIIENEFGEVGIDGNILKSSGIGVREINSGCICCTLAGDFAAALKEVLTTYAPDRVIIEPSGVGKLSDIIKACSTQRLHDLLTINMRVAVVDAPKFSIYRSNFGEFYEDQIIHAGTIVLSRTQKLGSAGLETVVESLRTLNGTAHIITTPWETLEAECILTVAEQDGYISLEQQLKNGRTITPFPLLNHKDCDREYNLEGTHEHTADKFFDVWGVETPKIFDQSILLSKLNDLGNERSFGQILRGKGIVQTDVSKWVQFDYVLGESSIIPSAADYTGRLCVIGRNLNKSSLSQHFGVSE